MQDVEVLAVQNLLDASGNQPQRAEVVTLLVTPQDAERLAAAIRLGALQIAMRGYDDRQTVSTTGVNSRELVGLPSIPFATQQSASSPTVKRVTTERLTQAKIRPEISVELMRNGKERQTVNFDQAASLMFHPQLGGATKPIETDPMQSDDSE